MAYKVSNKEKGTVEGSPLIKNDFDLNFLHYIFSVPVPEHVNIFMC